MSSNSQRFAQMVLAAFESEALVTDEQVHKAGGPSSTYMTGLRKAAEGAPMKEPRSDTYRRIERAASWKPGSGRIVWRGGNPERSRSSVEQMRDALGVSPDERPRQPRQRFYSGGPDGFTERVFDRVLDLEEQLEAVEARLMALEEAVSALSATTGPTQENHALAADDTEGKFEEQEADPNA